MRFPNLSDLDRDQAAIYEGASPDATILVVGPPGTGKTVIALHRAGLLNRSGRSPKVMMFSKVLKKYASNHAPVVNNIEITTMHGWMRNWWSEATGLRLAPTDLADKWAFDWDKIRDKIVTLIQSNTNLRDINWGHLIIDEGQDFPASMYTSMHVIMCLLNPKLAGIPSAVTVMADDNQRLEIGKNSTVAQIRKGLGLSEQSGQVFTLRKNYRNTLEIARFAANFYVGLGSGIPLLPERGGNLPSICVSENDSTTTFVERIARYAIAHDGVDIGVLVPNNSIRKKITIGLKKRLLGKGIVVQSYASGDKTFDVSDLVFDTAGYLTVLNFQSSKGLEFDSVFIVDPGSLSADSSAALHAKMKMYVMSSRARNSLCVLLEKNAHYDTFMSWLPGPEGNYKQEEI